MNAAEREALRLKIDQARRAQAPYRDPRQIDFPLGSTAQHGTANGYRLGCKCDSCRGAASAQRQANRRDNLERDRQRRREYYHRRRAAERQAAA